MNNIFNIKRFGLVFRKDILENWKRYMLLFLTMLGVLALFITFISLDYYSNERNNSDINFNLLKVISLFFGIFGMIFASTFMNPMNSKIKRMSYLINPSSNLEKFMTRWIIVTVGYIISFFIAIWIADILRVGICSARYPEIDVMFLDITKLISSDDTGVFYEYVFNKGLFATIIAMFFLFQSFFILGSTFWEKSTFVKTFSAGILILLSFALICRWTILIFYGSFNEFVDVLSSVMPSTNIDVNKENSAVITSSVISLFTLINWTLAYFRFRESEIIKRI